LSTSLLALVEKLAARPSIVWRLAWLAFCLLIVCLAGAPTLRGIAPYVLAGVDGRRTAHSRTANPTEPERVVDSRLASWVLPAIAWSLISASVVKWLVFS
jgi:hypothetical protein